MTFTDDHDVDTMTVSTSCVGLNIKGLSFPPGTLEHKITVSLNEVIVIESNILNGEYQVNEFLMLRQPKSGYSVSMQFYANGSVSGEIKEADFFLFGNIFSTGIQISDKISFTNTAVINIFNINLESQMFGEFDDSQDLVLYLTNIVVPESLIYNQLNNYVQEYILNQITVFNNRLGYLNDFKQKLEKLFYFHGDMVTKLQKEFDEYLFLHIEALEKVSNLTKSLDQYQTTVNALNISELNEIISVCEDGNCSTECAMKEKCSLCETEISYKHWGVGLAMNEENVAVTYKKDILDSKWTVGYFCRLITNIKSWGKTAYGQICSFKSESEIQSKVKWISENKLCNVSHFRAVEVNEYSVPVKMIFFSNHSDCAMDLYSPSCLISDSACNIAQLKMYSTLEATKQKKLEAFKNLLETKSALSVATTQAEKLSYRTQVAECALNLHQGIVNLLYDQISETKNNLITFSMEYSYIQQIESLILLNHTLDEFFDIKQISFDVTINGTTPSSFPLKISFESQVVDYVSEKTIVVDYHSPYCIIERDIAKSVLDNLKGQMINSRKRRSCILAEPSHNEKRFEQYCAIIGNIKEYFIELNATLNTITDIASNSKARMENLVTYNLLTYADKNAISIAIDIYTLNTFLDAPISKDMLLNLSLSSAEYTEVENTLQYVVNTSATVADTIDNTIPIIWWVMMNRLHGSFYNKIVDDRICFGFADCFKTVLIILQEIVDDSEDNTIPIIDMDLLNTAKEQALKLVTHFDELDHTWEILEPVYDIVLQIEEHTNWCNNAPKFLIQPDTNVYAEVGTNVGMSCEASHSSVYYKWLKNGFPMKYKYSKDLWLHNVGTNDEGQYQCVISNEAGETLSTASEVHVYTPLTLTKSPSNVTSYEGNEDDALFVCTTTGYPTPLYHWYFSHDQNNWELIESSSNEYVVYKPTKASIGWYKCQASIFEQTVESESAFLNVIGASISKISYRVSFNMAIYSIHPLHSMTDSYIQGLQESLVDAIKQGKVWLHGFIENTNIGIDNKAYQLKVSFYISAEYDYSLTKQIVEQALEADQYHIEVMDILEEMNSRLREASIWFEYGNDSMYAFPSTFDSTGPTYFCPVGKELMKNTFICGKKNTVSLFNSKLFFIVIV